MLCRCFPSNSYQNYFFPHKSPLQRRYMNVVDLVKRGQLKEAHATFLANPDVYGASALIARQHDLDSCFSIYSRLLQVGSPNAHVLTALVVATRRNNAPHKAAPLVDDIIKYRLVDRSLLTNVLMASLETQNCVNGTRIYNHMIVNRAPRDDYLNSLLLRMFSKSSKIDEAKRVFKDLKQPATQAWNVLLSSFPDGRRADEAIQIFEDMKKATTPDAITYTIMFKICAEAKDIRNGQIIHDHMIKSSVQRTPKLDTSIINMFAKCGEIDQTKRLFVEKFRRDGLHPPVETWNALLSSFSDGTRADEAIRLFHEMIQARVLPSARTFTILFKVCAQAQDIVNGTNIYHLMIKSGVQQNHIVDASLLNMFAKCSAIDEARRIFQKIRRTGVPSIQAWTAMLSAYLNDESRAPEAIKLFNEMKEHADLDASVYSVMLTICANSSNFELGSSLHAGLIQKGIPWAGNEILAGSLVNMYGKNGRAHEALEVFSEFKTKTPVGETMWATMINAVGVNGLSQTALDLFQEMINSGISPTLSSTFTSILSACSHGGRISEGMEIYWSMKSKYGIEPEVIHHACFVDLLSRNGKLDAAELFIEQVGPNLKECWGALLGGCRANCDYERANRVGKKLMELDPKDASLCVLVVNTCSREHYETQFE